MAKNKNEPDSDFLERIAANTELAFEHQERDQWLQRSRMMKDQFYGKYYSYADAATEPKYIVNIIYQLTNLIIPFWFIQAPEVTVIPSKPFYKKKDPTTGLEVEINNIKNAEKHQQVLNKVIKDIGLEKEIRKALFDILFYGIGIIKVGVVNKSEKRDDLSDNPKIKIFAKRVNPEHFGHDQTATNPNEARYLTEIIFKPKCEFDDNKSYENKDNVSTDIPHNLEFRAGIDKTKDYDLVALTEYHDQENGEIAVHSGTDKKHLHRRIDRPYQFKGSDYSALTLSKGNEDFIGVPPFSMIQDQVYALHESYSMTVDHQRLFPGQVVVEESAVSEDHLDAMENGGQGSILTVADGALAEGRIQRWTALHMNQEYLQVLQLHRQMIEQTLGISDAKAGLARKKTATETQVEDAEEAVIEADTLGMIKDWVLDIVSKISSLVKQYYNDEDYIRILGKKGWKFYKYTKEEIQGDFEFDFSVESMRVAKAQRAQTLINALNILGAHPLFAERLAQKDLDGVIDYLFESMTSLPKDKFSKDPKEMLPNDPEEENEAFLNDEEVFDPHPEEDQRAHLDKHFAIADQMEDDPAYTDHIRKHIDLYRQQLAEQQMQLQAMQQQQVELGTEKAQVQNLAANTRNQQPQNSTQPGQTAKTNG